MNTLEKMRKAFPSARWEKPDILPVYVLRHGKIKDNVVKRYSTDYPFVGNAKSFEIERGIRDDFWNEQLVPWPWFVVLVAKPDDGILITDAENDPERTKFFWLIFADENGMIPFQIPREKDGELKKGFDELRKEKLFSKTPKFRKSMWFKEMEDDIWEQILKKGTMLSTI